MTTRSLTLVPDEKTPEAAYQRAILARNEAADIIFRRMVQSLLNVAVDAERIAGMDGQLPGIREEARQLAEDIPQRLNRIAAIRGRGPK